LLHFFLYFSSLKLEFFVKLFIKKMIFYLHYCPVEYLNIYDDIKIIN